MRLYNKKYDFTLELKENKINHLVIENPGCMVDVINSIYNQIEGHESDFYLTEMDKIVNWNKTVDFVINPFVIDCNDKKVISKIYKDIEADVLEKHIEEVAEINSQILKLIDYIFESNYTGLISDENLSLQGLFKLYNIKVNSNPDTLLEKILDYMRITSDVLGYTIYIFLNLNHYLSGEELMGLYEFVTHKKINFINISGNDYFVPNEHNKTIIDVSLCKIVN